MRAGKLRHTVIIQTNAGEGNHDSFGRKSDAWIDTVQGVRASIETLSGDEREEARKTVATATHKITTRYHALLANSRARFKFGDTIYSIGHVENMDERNIMHVCTCTREA